MFAARGIAVSFSVFAMVYCVLSLAVCLGWRTVRLHSQRPARQSTGGQRPKRAQRCSGRGVLSE